MQNTFIVEDIMGRRVQFNIVDNNLTKDEGRLFDKLHRKKWEAIFILPNDGETPREMILLANSYQFKKAYPKKTVMHENAKVVLLVACYKLSKNEKRKILKILDK